MSCARVLNAVGSYRQSAKMPVDLAVGLSQHQPLYQRLSISSLKPGPRQHQLTGRHSLLHSSSSSLYSSSPRPSSPAPSEPRSCFRRDAGGSPSKKRVVFADAIGLALTAVRLFIAEPSAIAATLGRRPSFAQLQSQQWTSDKLQRNRLSFPRPTLALPASLARQQDSCVQLESCNVSGQSLSGKVRVNHVSVDKTVHVRATFDSWRSHHDIPCTFLQRQQLGGSEVDLFSFDVSLPKHKEPTERGEFFVEFCVAFRPRPGATPHWDNNGGQNYRVCVDAGGSNGHRGNAFRCHPTLSQHRPPASPTVQNAADPHHLQGTLSSRVRGEWNTL
ncbi:protein phosphatase 1 regulatory subunit 3C [Pseudoliparis swirei]|uniref:protein phosphatase 1 regulatory subunit 3C n=1 Tax=Pseudoliparis swirei TaxID=2059687 RepID=UPI0024BE3E62|nr:protein phosphatase 1 regulatory subunit 3C [Pseudoliparis swirei]